MRQWLFGLYYTVYTGIATPFPALADQVAPYLKACIHIIGHSLLPTQRVKLTTFIKVWLLRRRNGDNLPATPRHYTAGGYDALSAALETAGESPVPTAECDYLYQFLVTQHYLELPAAQLPTLFPLADELTRQFIAQLAQSNVATLTEPILRDLTSRLMQIHLRFTTFYLEPTTFIAADQVSFFANLYPEFETVITRFLNGLKARPEFNLSENMLTNLYFSDMFALINTIPSTALTQVIQICVDFSAGALYSDYVMRSLAAFGHANIRVTQNLDANTDIYIADFHADDLTIPQVIWQNPPTPHDWSQLAALILDCTQQKGGRA
ncbi:hypothetical protein [Lacticaseibacillus nasuensis]|uniref:hypothetical protein n=1 Tax=Lacticaseibacillus nasuensis TaxID=944671 RepID=UPI001584AE08|nr:hypothetical protein [Lacticaseibacillus nasuensis]